MKCSFFISLIKEKIGELGVLAAKSIAYSV